MASSPNSEIVIEPGRKLAHYWIDVWRYRELFYFLAWRDILVRFKQTVIGVAWSVIRPLLTMVVFTIIFGRIAKLSSGGVPYPILVYAAMLPWQLFAGTFSDSSSALINNSSLVSKVYFPRLIIPATPLVVALVDFCISFSILIGLMAWYNYWPTWRVLALPLFILLALVAAFGAGLWISALNVKYRDFKQIVPFVVQLGLYISPVGFSSALVPERWRFFYSMNPMVGVIDGFRWCILGADIQLYIPGFCISLALAFLLLVSGLWFFRKTERMFADVI